MKRNFSLTVLFISLLLAACGKSTPTPTQTPAITSTPDRCSSANLPDEVGKVNKLMREFDDYSSLASNTPQAQLIQVIPDLQRVLRDAQDQTVPDCLQTLKNLQMAHMNAVIQTLLFLYGHPISAASPDPNMVKTINDGIGQARALHGKYDIELARLLGITLVPQSTVTPGGAQATVAPSATAVVAYVTNPGPTGINLHSSPGLNAPGAGLLDVQVSTAAIGKTADNQWIKVEVPGQPGQTAWIFASLVQLSVPIDQLPITQ